MVSVDAKDRSFVSKLIFFQLLFQISCKSDIQHRTEDAAATNELIGAVIEKGPTGQGCAMTRQRPPLRFFKVNGATAMAMLKARNNFTRNSAMTTFNEAALAAWKEATAAALVGHSLVIMDL